MNALTLIEKSGTRKGEYVAYCNGAQRIRQAGGVWQTYALGSSAGEFTYAEAETLAALNAKLEKLRR